MLRFVADRRRLTLALAACLAISLPNRANPIPRQDRTWKIYFNRQIGYCVSYPARWLKSDTFDGAGLAVATGTRKRSPIPIGSIDVSALPANGPEVRPASLSLTEDVDVQVEGLRRFARAEQLELVEKREIVLGTNSGIFVKIRYLDPRDRKVWVDEIIFAHRNRLTYRLEMETRADQLERLEAVFARFVNSFKMDCSSASVVRDSGGHPTPVGFSALASSHK